MRIILASDHGGFEMKEEIAKWLRGQDVQIKDVGAETLEPEDDFVDYAVKAMTSMIDNDKLVLFCRNGIGMSIVANRFKGVRCAVGFDIKAVEKARSDDNVNALAVPADYIDIEIVKKMITAMMEVSFSSEERYKRRLEKLGKL
jgi:RpiB/LacA/LacB family sugar-phosphate isomerase